MNDEEITGEQENRIPFVTDLDGTLINTDVSVLTFIKMLRKKPYTIALIPFWALRGRYYLKMKSLKLIGFSAANLPYIEIVVDMLKKAKSDGRGVYLATASMHEIAEIMQQELGIFDAVFGSTDGENLRSSIKLAKLQTLFGERGFDYIGDSKADIKVWAGARLGFAVNPSPEVMQAIESLPNVQIISKEKPLNFWKIAKDVLCRKGGTP